MILICPECATQYSIPDSAITEDGRKVKCVSCNHVWHQMPIEEKEDTDTPEKMADDIDSSSDSSTDTSNKNVDSDSKDSAKTTTKNSTADEENSTTSHQAPSPANDHIPAVAPPIKVSKYIKFSFLFFLLTSLIAGVIKFHAAPDITGQTNYQGITITDFVADKTEGTTGWNFDLTIKVENTAKEERPIPPINITVLSEGGNEMNHFTLHSDEITHLLPSDSYTFENILTNVSGHSHTLLFDIGNSWELAFR